MDTDILVGSLRANAAALLQPLNPGFPDYGQRCVIIAADLERLADDLVFDTQSPHGLSPRDRALAEMASAGGDYPPGLLVPDCLKLDAISTDTLRKLADERSMTHKATG